MSGVASIDGFLDHFEFEPAPRPLLRASLRSLRPRSRKAFEPGNVLLWLLVAILHVGLFVLLDFAMRPAATAHDAPDAPLQVTFIRLVETAKPRLIAPPAVRDLSRAQPLQQHLLPPAEPALRAIEISQRTIPPPVPKQIPVDPSPALVIYDRLGAIRLPAQVTPKLFPKPSDPFAHGPAANMLPGSDRELAHGFHVRAEKSPQQVVEFVGAMLLGGGHFDPCPDYAQRLFNADNETERDEQIDRYERACPGR